MSDIKKVNDLEERVQKLENYVRETKARWSLILTLSRTLGWILVLIGIIEFIAQNGLIK